MFEAVDVKRAVTNLPGQHLLTLGNSIINLDDVSEILRDPQPPSYKVVFIFKNGREREFVYETRSEHSFALRFLDHCIESNLLSLQLTSECYAKWNQYRIDEIDNRTKPQQ
ncbi:hypothetical protein EGT09_02195 [Pseudomonas putida]|uniref:hypothetical protein n=1 Tax=Pseudomonas putida TaxID=303 RepID=UPI000F7AC84A|nr:hypothetical protein [Pseudomonas putida]RSC25277.1 hypothetical protein EGT09_02195 [Pseudomonas putida]